MRNTTPLTENKVPFEAHLQAIENAVNNASLDGGCDFSDHVVYHCEKIRAIWEAVEDGLAERMVENGEAPFVPEFQLGEKI